MIRSEAVHARLVYQGAVFARDSDGTGWSFFMDEDGSGFYGWREPCTETTPADAGSFGDTEDEAAPEIAVFLNEMGAEIIDIDHE